MTTSGRESLPPSERIGLIRADLMAPPFLGIGPASAAVTMAIHDLKITIALMHDTIAMFERAVARGETDATLARGADRVLSPLECLILAWRRGGHREYQRVLAAQRELR